MSDSDTLIFFGLNGIILHDSIKAKLQEKAEREARIAEKFLRLEALLNGRTREGQARDWPPEEEARQ